MSTKNTPSYIRLYESGELERRVEKALANLEKCQVCARKCGINRLVDERKFCRIGRYAQVASYGPHLGEENCLRGWKGSGTIFFAGCNLQCVFCQNFDISYMESGIEVQPSQLAGIMLELQDKGCHNINLVTPSHAVPQIMEALPEAISRGLDLPIVYNTGSFDSLETLRLLDGIVDIYMPDFKYWHETPSKHYLNAPKYCEVARSAIREMHRQVGDLVFDQNGLAQRGLLIRHLVMPEGLENTDEIMRFLANEISTDTFVNIMAQYHPSGKVSSANQPELNRRITRQELSRAFELAQEAGLHRFDER